MSRGSQRAVFGVNAGVSVALVLLVAAIALVVKPPAPPGIAAFAPQAAKPITKAPPGQSSVSGDGSGQCAAGQICVGKSPRPRATPTASVAASLPPTGPPKGVPSALQCYTWPDGTVTQTFDPQSPPCVASWPEQDKGNGGKTSPGVTATTVRVAFPQAPPSDSFLPRIQALVNFFNTRYQFYGRKIELVPFQSQEAGSQAAGHSESNPSFQKADAEAAAALKPFAAMDIVDMAPYIAALPTYLDTLAAKKVVSIAGGTITPNVSSADLDRHHPYEWSYQPTADQLMATTARLTCAQLVGKTATHATAYVAVKRKFAVVLPDPKRAGIELPGVDGMLKTLAGCGISKPPVVYYTNNEEDASTLSASFLQLRNQGVTSLLFYSAMGPGSQGAPQKVASNVGYRPEWITMGFYHWAAAGLAVGAADEIRSTFGVGAWNKLVPLHETVWVQAHALGGGDPATVGNVRDGEAVYHELSMLAAGMQMAGPHLTPETFAAALQSTQFSDPGAATAPSYQATVGFGPGGHTFMKDYAAWWMDPSANAAQTTAIGTSDALNAYINFCYVRLGRRWSDLTWPSSDEFYQGGCR